MNSEFLEQLQQMSEMELTDSLPDRLPEEYQMPAYLKTQIITRTQQPDIQVKSPKRTLSKRMELFLYSCKVTAAVAASLVIIVTVSATQGQLQDLQNRNTAVVISEKIYESSQSITSWLQAFPDSIFEKK